MIDARAATGSSDSAARWPTWAFRSSRARLGTPAAGGPTSRIATFAILPSGDFELVLAQQKPPPHELQAATWVEIPADASGVVVRQ